MLSKTGSYSLELATSTDLNQHKWETGKSTSTSWKKIQTERLSVATWVSA